MFWKNLSRPWGWRSFLKSESKGSMAVEGALLLPLFIVIYIGSTTLFQVQGVDASYIHAATTLSDLVTRQIVINDSTANNLYATTRSLVLSDDDFIVSMTSVSYDPAMDKFFINWSASNVNGSELKDEDIEKYKFPAMEDTESVMLVTVQGSTVPLFQDFFEDAKVNFFKHSIRRPRFVRLVDSKI
ncbi:MAG: hypothetical protein ABJK39_10965 [Hyphomicrobiales bacterium]